MPIIHGFIIVNKPSGVPSFAMVRLVRRLTGVRRVGHAGTLDPLASGVLPVAVGHATRFIEYLDDESKTYVARIRFGATSTTYDAEGELTPSHARQCIEADALKACLREFLGYIEQRPPLYSALKVAGRPLYSYAREGTDVEVRSRQVRIDAIELRWLQGDEAEIEVVCGRGTYIRSLAHDVGQRLGCGAYLAGLVRTSSGGFQLDEAYLPETLEEFAAGGRLQEAVLAPDRALERRPAAILAGEHAAGVRTGRDIAIEAATQAIHCRAYDDQGAFLGVLERRSSRIWHPAKMVPRPIWPEIGVFSRIWPDSAGIGARFA